jgi:hypothetical protein
MKDDRGEEAEQDAWADRKKGKADWAMTQAIKMANRRLTVKLIGGSATLSDEVAAE